MRRRTRALASAASTTASARASSPSFPTGFSSTLTGRFNRRQHVGQRRDPFVTEPGREPGTGVELPDLRGGCLTDGARAVRRPVERPVVHDDHLPVAGELHVELDHVRAEAAARRNAARVFSGQLPLAPRWAITRSATAAVLRPSSGMRQP